MKTGLRQQKNAVRQRLREPVRQLSTLHVRTSHTSEKQASSYRDLTIMMDNAAALASPDRRNFISIMHQFVPLNDQ